MNEGVKLWSRLDTMLAEGPPAEQRQPVASEPHDPDPHAAAGDAVFKHFLERTDYAVDQALNMDW